MLSIKKTGAAAIVAAFGLTLGGCFDFTNPNSIDISATITTFLDGVQADTKAACTVIPTIDSIIALANANAGATASALSTIICSAVAAVPTAQLHVLRSKYKGVIKPTPIVINGVVVSFL